MAEPFTLRVFVPDGDPEGVRVIDRMNWTGISVAFPRTKWQEVRLRPELQRTGVYVLVGTVEEDDLPTIYVGQADSIRNRIDSHSQGKDFWDSGVAFVSSSGGLNRAHVTWLEYALIKRANEAKRCHLDNGNLPQEPALTESEKADTQGFLNEVLRILPLVGLRAFELPKPIAVPFASESDLPGLKSGEPDTIIVPAQKEGFDRVFLGEDCWYSIRISGGMLSKIRYVAGYQTAPVSAITHYAQVARIEPYGEGGKYKLIFSAKATPIGPIQFGDAPQGMMQGPRYTTFAKLETAKKLTDLLGRPV